jgi:hypothetical protein
VTDDNRVVLIGTGPGGAAAATFLAQAGIEVLVLEAGPENMDMGLMLRVRGATIAKYRRELQQRPHVEFSGDKDSVLFEELAPGGLSNHWSCAVQSTNGPSATRIWRLGMSASSRCYTSLGRLTAYRKCQRARCTTSGNWAMTGAAWRTWP